MKIYQTYKSSYKAFISTSHIFVNLINNSTGFITITFAINICIKYFQKIPNNVGILLIIVAWTIWLISMIDNINNIKEGKIAKGVIILYVFIYVGAIITANFILNFKNI